MINDTLLELKNMARQLAKKLPVTSFYLDHAAEVEFAWDLFFDHPMILDLQQDSLAFLYDDYMFGIEHSKKVAQDTAAIVLAEESNLTQGEKRHLALLAQLAGLLHDIQHDEDNHALRSAEAVIPVLENYNLDKRDIELIGKAIAGHENHVDPGNYPDTATKLLCQALYDADKFRFGPDIFPATMWLFCDYESWSLAEIAKQFPKGIHAAKSAKHTFRTSVGKHYGPEIIEQGIGLGETMLQQIINASKKG